MSNTTNILTAARAEAVFTSHLSSYSHPTSAEVADVIKAAVRAHRGTRGCAAEVAFAYGERPETAAPRMRWALQLVEAFYPTPAPAAGMRWSVLDGAALRAA